MFASTIQAGVLGPGEPDDLDDAAIERSIAEINEAIRRSRGAQALNGAALRTGPHRCRACITHE